jgi:hypothetical protein
VPFLHCEAAVCPLCALASCKYRLDLPSSTPVRATAGCHAVFAVVRRVCTAYCHRYCKVLVFLQSHSGRVQMCVDGPGSLLVRNMLLCATVRSFAVCLRCHICCHALRFGALGLVRGAMGSSSTLRHLRLTAPPWPEHHAAGTGARHRLVFGT